MSFRNKIHLSIRELTALRKRCWKQCKKWATKSRHSFQQNTSSSTVYGITDPVFGTVGLVNNNIIVQNDRAVDELHQSIEDSHISFEHDLEQAWSSREKVEGRLTNSEKERMQRENRLDRTRKSLRDSSLTKSKRTELQLRAIQQRRLVAQSNRHIKTEQETLRREDEYFSNVMAVIFQQS